MTRTLRATKNNPKKSDAPHQSSTEPTIAMKPRPKLFIALLILFLAWIGFMIGMYFKTVYHRTDVHERGGKVMLQK